MRSRTTRTMLSVALVMLAVGCASSTRVNELAGELERGASLAQAMAGQRIWEKRKPLIRQGLRFSSGHWQGLLRECQRADRTIKGLEPLDPWLLLQELALGIAGISPKLH